MLDTNSLCQTGAFSVVILTSDNEEIKLKAKKLIAYDCAVTLVMALFLHPKASLWQ